MYILLHAELSLIRFKLVFDWEEKKGTLRILVPCSLLRHTSGCPLRRFMFVKKFQTNFQLLEKEKDKLLDALVQ